MSDSGQTLFRELKPRPEASKDPIRVMIEIAEHPTLPESYKAALIEYAQSRFKNRRRMAYMALIAILVSLVLLFIAAFVDGLNGKQSGDGIMALIEANQSVIIWIEGFLTAIVGAYYGVTAWRPSS